jgi:hypothetical protein
VVATGVAVASLEPVRAHLAAGDYDEEYIFYVLAQVKKQVQNGKVKKEGGAVYKALLDGYLLPAYQKTKLTPASAKVKAALSRHRKKLLSELEDAHKSLGWAQTAVIYSDETRPAAIAKIKATILGLEQQLLALGSPSPTPAP